VPLSSAKVVIGCAFLAAYPQGGGLWAGILQYLLALESLGHDVFWIELLRSSGDPDTDRDRIRRFFEEFTARGYGDRCALLLVDARTPPPPLSQSQAFGHSLDAIRKTAQSSDILWNFAGGLNEPLLELFTRRAYIDGDPGMVQIAAFTWDMAIDMHEVLFTVGLNMHRNGCEVPTLGRSWHTFMPSVDLASWPVAPPPAAGAGFTSVTQWTWEEYAYEGRVLSVSKRAAYLRYVELPRIARRRFELAANIGDNDVADDRSLLSANGWTVADPHAVAGTIEDYAKYIEASYAELSCPKPIYRELKTGWFSDRSACYLAAGRPVLAEDTGLSHIVPADYGFVTFTDFESALAGVQAIDANYATHRAAARAFAEQFLDARRNVTRMLELCF